MKTIAQKTVMTDFGGNPVHLGEKEVLTLRHVLLGCLGRFTARQDGVQNAALWALGCKMHNKTEATYELEDAEFKLVQAAVKQNGPQFYAMVLGQVHELLKEKA